MVRRSVPLGELLRSRRAAYDPSRLPLPSHGQRRVPGIRREELAYVAGVSTSYYTRIEQGAVSPSDVVLDAIADALELDPHDRALMHRLSRGHDGPVLGSDPRWDRVALEQLITGVAGSPAGLLAPDTTVLAWNRACHAVFAPHVPFEAPWAATGGPVWARLLFLDEACRRLFVDWEVVADDLVGRMRAAQASRPDGVALRRVVGGLRSRSAEFARLWDSYPVRVGPLGTVRLRHPVLGPLELRDTTLRPTDTDDVVLHVFQAEPGSDSAAALRGLADRWSTADVVVRA